MQKQAWPALRALIVVGEALVAIDLADMLTDLGHVVVATENRIDRALALVEAGGVDVAIVDIRVRGQLSFAFARRLQHSGVRVIFASSCGSRALIEGFRDFPVLRKPFFAEALAAVLTKTCGDGAARSLFAKQWNHMRQPGIG